jgi:hypothetical protein
VSCIRIYSNKKKSNQAPNLFVQLSKRKPIPEFSLERSISYSPYFHFQWNKNQSRLWTAGEKLKKLDLYDWVG